MVVWHPCLWDVLRCLLSNSHDFHCPPPKVGSRGVIQDYHHLLPHSTSLSLSLERFASGPGYKALGPGWPIKVVVADHETTARHRGVIDHDTERISPQNCIAIYWQPAKYCVRFKFSKEWIKGCNLQSAFVPFRYIWNCWIFVLTELNHFC